jgi:DHA1 family solute carrier family 18 vesicular amine transporter 1/2
VTAPDRRRTFVFLVATGLIAVETMLFTMVGPALPVFAERHGLSDPEAALIFAAFPVAQLAASLGAAGLIERFGRRPAMAGGAAVLLLATLAFAVAGDPASLVLARSVQGIAAGIAWTAGIAAISDVFPADQLGFRIGLAGTAGGGFGLVGPVVGGALIEAVGTGRTFALAAILPALLVVPALAVPETRRAARAAPRLLGAFRRVLSRPAARAGAAGLGTAAAVLSLLEPLLPLELDARLGLSPSAVGLVFAAGLLANFAASPIAGRWSDRRGRRRPLLVGGALMTAGLPLLAIGPAVAVALAFALVGIGFATMAAPSGPLLTQAVDEAGLEGMYGFSAALLTTVYAAGYTVGPVTGAGLRALLPFWCVVAIAAAGVAAVAIWAAGLIAEPRGQTFGARTR